MGLTTDFIEPDAVRLRTTIPEDKDTLPGLDYGGHVTMMGGDGYYVRPAGRADLPWGVARMRADQGVEAGTVKAITDELEAAQSGRD